MTSDQYFCVAIMCLLCHGSLWVALTYPDDAFPFGRIGRILLHVNSVVLIAVCFATLTYGLLN